MKKELDVEYCDHFTTLEEAQDGCQCHCDEPERSYTYYHCSYGNCCGYHCEKCGKFEVVREE